MSRFLLIFSPFIIKISFNSLFIDLIKGKNKGFSLVINSLLTAVENR